MYTTSSTQKDRTETLNLGAADWKSLRKQRIVRGCPFLYGPGQFVESFLLFVEKIYATANMAIILETIATKPNQS
jgi:hypothetical protein